MRLIISAEKNAGFCLGLATGGKLVDYLVITEAYKQAELLLLKIETILNKNRLTKNDLDLIIVAVGPGEFSALRTGIATANALGLALNVRVVGVILSRVEKTAEDKLNYLLKKGEAAEREKTPRFVLPKYGAEPNIGLKKK